MARLSKNGDIITGERSECVNCHHAIRAVIDRSSGVVDWESLNRRGFGAGDFGCGASPLNDAEGTGGHDPGPGHTPLGFRTKEASHG